MWKFGPFWTSTKIDLFRSMASWCFQKRSIGVESGTFGRFWGFLRLGVRYFETVKSSWFYSYWPFLEAPWSHTCDEVNFWPPYWEFKNFNVILPGENLVQNGPNFSLGFFFTNGHKKCPSTTNIETKYIAWRSSPHHNFAFKLKQPLLNT